MFYMSCKSVSYRRSDAAAALSSLSSILMGSGEYFPSCVQAYEVDLVGVVSTFEPPFEGGYLLCPRDG